MVPPLDCQFGRDGGGKGELLLQRRAVAKFGREKGGELAHAVRQFLLPDSTEIFDDRALHHRLLACLQHAGDGDRHATQGVELRHQAAQPFGAAHIGFGAERADQFKHHVEGLEKAFRSAALIGELAGGLLPGAVNLAHHVIVGNEGVVEHHFVEIMLPGHLIDRIDRDARRLHVHQKLSETVAAVLFGGDDVLKSPSM